MDPGQWLSGFREQHEKMRAGRLSEGETRRYLSMREELARSLASSQGLTVPEGQNARKFFRVAQVYTVEINNLYKGLTKDISRSGFSTIVPTSMKEGDPLAFSFVLKRGEDPVTGRGKVITALKQQGNTRISCSIDTISDANAERLEMALFDAVLSRIK